MTHFILIILAVTLFSCSNKKDEIVEQIKSYKDSLGVVNKRTSELNQQIMAVNEKYSGQQALDSSLPVQQGQIKERAELYVKTLVFQEKIDSLELELKKY